MKTSGTAIKKLSNKLAKIPELEAKASSFFWVLDSTKNSFYPIIFVENRFWFRKKIKKVKKNSVKPIDTGKRLQYN